MEKKGIYPPKEWKKADGSTVACTEKVKVLNENWNDLQEALQDALDDAILMGCTQSQFKAEYHRLIESLLPGYRESEPQAKVADARQASFSIVKCDHIVLTVKSIARSIEFYCGLLGMTEQTSLQGRKAVSFATGKINLHEVTQEAILPRASHPTEGSADICLIVSRPIEHVMKELQEKGATIEMGPVVRTGTFCLLRSIYLRDPDGNLVELACEIPS